MTWLIVFQFFLQTEYKDVAYQIAAMSILETGWYSSKTHLKRRNLFSMKDFSRKQAKPIHYLKTYPSYKASMQDFLAYLRRKNYPKNEREFYKALVKNRYAQDRNYVRKLRAIVRRLRNEQK